MAAVAIHPGRHLSEELRTLGMGAAELARKLDVPTDRVTQILNGRRAITGDTALRLAHFFGTSPELWLNLQNFYELRLAQRKAGKIIKGLPTLKHSEPAGIRCSEFRWLPRSVTEVQHFYDVFFFVDPIINNNGTVVQFSDAGTLSDCATHARESPKQIHMVEQCATETPGCLVVILGNVADDFREVC